jgi:predicted esterase
MLIWRGLGFLTPLFLVFPVVGCLMAGGMLLSALPDRFALVPIILAFPVGMALAGLACWKFGTAVNKNKPYAEAHTAFFVRIEHWGIVTLILAAMASALCLPVAAAVALLPPSEPLVENAPADVVAAVPAQSKAEPRAAVARPERPFALAHPALPEQSLEELGLERFSATKLTLAARMAIAEENNELAALLQRWAVENGATEYYNLACYESLCGNLDAAIYWLQEAAIVEGVNVEWSEQDTDLANLRGDVRWPKVLGYLTEYREFWRASDAEDHQILLPANYDGEPIPVFVWLHGRGDRAASYIFPELQEIADRERVAFVSVSGTQVEGPRSYSWAEDLNANEARIQAALAKFEPQLKVQSGRVALGGFSQGGLVAAELAALQPNRYCGALVMSPGGLSKLRLTALEPTDAHRKQVVIAVCGAGEHQVTVFVTKECADWFKKAGAQVQHLPYPDMADHSPPPDLEARLPEWVPVLLLIETRESAKSTEN